MPNTSSSGGRWIKTDYPTRDTDNPILEAEESLIQDKEKEGLDNGW